MGFKGGSSKGGGGGGGNSLPTGGASGQVIGWKSSGVGQWVYPPGYQFGYAQITSGVNVTATSSAAPTNIISPGAITFDGGTVLAHFFAWQLTLPTPVLDEGFFILLREGSTILGSIAVARTLNTSEAKYWDINGFWEFTPTAGSHTYTVDAWVQATAGTPAVSAGPAGATDGEPTPSFIRFTKV